MGEASTLESILSVMTQPDYIPVALMALLVGLFSVLSTLDARDEKRGAGRRPSTRPH